MWKKMNMNSKQIVALFLFLMIPFTGFAQRRGASGLNPSALEDVVIETKGSLDWLGVVIETGGSKYMFPMRHDRAEKKFSARFILDASGLSKLDHQSRASNFVQSNDGFNAFYGAFKKAVFKNDRSAIRAMMSPRFEWALDGYVSRDEALQTMDRNKRWAGLRNALTRRPVRCKQPYCNNRSGYRIWSSPKYRFETMFERGADGQWKWSAVLGD
jgi:hypothetical protein